MIEGGYSTGSTIASQLGRFRPVPELTGHRDRCSRTSTTARPTCTRARESGAGSSYNCFQEIARALQLPERGRRRVSDRGAASRQARDRHRRGAGPRSRVRAAPGRTWARRCSRPTSTSAELLRDRARSRASAGWRCSTGTADVTSRDRPEHSPTTARELMGGLDALVNNAAIVAGLTPAPFDEIPEDEWDRVLAVNVKGAWLCAQGRRSAAARAGGGSIVNLASEVAFSGSPGLAHYVDLEGGGDRADARRSRASSAGSQIRVNALRAGFIETEGSRSDAVRRPVRHERHAARPRRRSPPTCSGRSRFSSPTRARSSPVRRCS